MSEDKPAKQMPRNALRLASVGVELAATVGVGCLLGYWIDYKFPRAEPWGLVICAMIGVIGGVYNLIRHAVHEMVMPRDRARRGGGGENQAEPDGGTKRTDS